MSLKIPYNLSSKIADFPQNSDNLNQVTLILINGSKINEVCLTRGGEIIKVRNTPINGIKDLDFNIFDINDVISEI